MSASEASTCPICKKKLKGAKGEAKPFCSARCRQVDLGRWLNEEYRVPAEEADDAPSEEEEPS